MFVLWAIVVRLAQRFGKNWGSKMLALYGLGENALLSSTTISYRSYAFPYAKSFREKNVCLDTIFTTHIKQND
jgi:hypothetical protein